MIAVARGISQVKRAPRFYTTGTSVSKHLIKSRMPEKSETMLFPTKLHFCLTTISNDPKLSNIVSWLPCGRAFKIHDPISFANLVLPKYFGGMHSLRSFRRQLNIYGFKKLLKSRLELEDDGSDEKIPKARNPKEKQDFIGSYYHPLFQQGRKELTTKMLRHFTSKTSIASHRGQSKKKETAQQCPTGDKQHGQPSSLDDKEEFDLILDGIESILSDGDSSSSQGGYNISMPKDNKQLKPCSVFVPPKGPGYLAAPCREIKFENAFSVTAAWNYSSSSTHQNHFLSENHWFEFASSSMEDMQQFDHEDIRREIVKTFMHTQIQLD